MANSTVPTNSQTRTTTISGFEACAFAGGTLSAARHAPYKKSCFMVAK